jgi:hypothetical protein
MSPSQGDVSHAAASSPVTKQGQMNALPKSTRESFCTVTSSAAAAVPRTRAVVRARRRAHTDTVRRADGIAEWSTISGLLPYGLKGPSILEK